MTTSSPRSSATRGRQDGDAGAGPRSGGVPGHERGRHRVARVDSGSSLPSRHVSCRTVTSSRLVRRAGEHHRPTRRQGARRRVGGSPRRARARRRCRRRPPAARRSDEAALARSTRAGSSTQVRGVAVGGVRVVRPRTRSTLDLRARLGARPPRCASHVGAGSGSLLAGQHLGRPGDVAGTHRRLRHVGLSFCQLVAGVGDAERHDAGDGRGHGGDGRHGAGAVARGVAGGVPRRSGSRPASRATADTTTGTTRIMPSTDTMADAPIQKAPLLLSERTAP